MFYVLYSLRHHIKISFVCIHSLNMAKFWFFFFFGFKNISGLSFCTLFYATLIWGLINRYFLFDLQLKHIKIKYKIDRQTKSSKCTKLTWAIFNSSTKLLRWLRHSSFSQCDYYVENICFFFFSLSIKITCRLASFSVDCVELVGEFQTFFWTKK